MADEVQVQDPQQPTPYINRVYSALKDNLTGFNKTPEQFAESMKDSAYAARAYSALKDNLTGFDKTPDDFYKEVGVPKKATPSGGGYTLPSFQNGSNPFPLSPQGIDLSPVLPEHRAEVAQRQQQDLIQQQQKATDFSNRLKDVYNAADPTLKKEIGKIQGLPLKQETASATPQSEIDHMNFMNSTLGKIVTPLAYLGSKASHGGLQIAKGVAHLANMAQNPAGNPIIDQSIDQGFAKADKAANLGLSEGDISNIENGSGKGNKALSAMGMLAEFAPAIAGGEAAAGTKLPAALMYLQGVGAGKDAADKIEGLNPVAKEALIQGSGVVNLALTDLGSNLFGKGVSAVVKDKVVAGIAADAIKESAGKQLTADSFKSLLENKAASFADKFERAPMEALRHYTDAAKTFTKLDVGNFAVHKAVDKIQEASGDQPVFNENAGTLAENLNKSMTEAVPMFGTLGALGGASKLLPNSSYENDVVKSVMNDPSPENVDAIKQQIHDHGFGDHQDTKWTPEEMDATFQHVNKIADAAKSLPTNIPENKRSKAIGLVLDRNVLQDELKGVQDAKSSLDPAVKDVVTPKEQYLTDKIEQANDKLRDVVTGKRTTYSKGVDDKEEGKVFKTIDGTKEEISPSRYDLENTEREAKKQINEKTVPKEETANPVAETKTEASGSAEDTKPPEETPKITVNEVKDKPIVYHGEPADIIQDGQTLVAKIKNSNREYELGNVDEVGDKSIKDLGIEHQNSVVDTHDNGNITVRGKEYVNNYSDPKMAINHDGDGNVVSVNLETPDGAKRTFKGDIAEDIAYQIHLKELNKDNETKQQFEQFVEQHEPSKSAIVAGENEVAAEKGTVEDNAPVSRKRGRPKKVVETNESAKEIGITEADVKRDKEFKKATEKEPSPIKNAAPTTETTRGDNGEAKSTSKPVQSSEKAKEEVKPEHQSLTEEELARKKELRKKFMSRLNDITNIPTLLADKEFREYAGLIFKEAAGDFKHFSSELIDAFGAKIKEHLPALFDELKETDKTEPAKNEANESIAAELGLKVDDSATGKRTDKVIEKEASEAIAKGYNTPELIDNILNEGHTATDTEVAILAKYRDAKYDEIKAQQELLASDGATMSKKQFEALTRDNEASLNDMQDVVQAIRKTGSTTGSALRARQLDLQKEYSLGNMIAQKRQALGGEKLTPEELSAVTKRFTEMEETQKALEARLKKVEEQNAKLQAEKQIKRTPIKRSTATKAELNKELSGIFNSIRDDFKKIRQSGQALSDIPYRRELAAVAKHMPALLRNLAQQGVVRIEDVVDNIYTALKSDLEDITKRDVTDLIAGKYNEVKPTRSELQDNIRSLRTQAKLIAQIEDAEKGIKPTDKPSVAKEKNEKIEALKQRLKELTKEEGPSKEEQSLANLKKRLQDNIDKISKKLADGDFSKEEPKKPVTPDAEALNLRRKYDRIKNDFDIQVAKDALKQRSKTEKLKDDLLNIASLPRALKASLDFSAVLRQGLFSSVGHPKEALTAFKEMFRQTFSEEKYKNWISDLKHSEYYDLMKNSELYLSDKNDPKIIAREEEFTSNLADKIPVIGKAIAASERAYTGYLNVLRAGVFESEARELIKRGYTFENNPEIFKGVAKVVNVLTGRGDVPEFLGGKTPKVLSNVLFSPRFMAARIQTLYLWADPRLPRAAKVMAAKDIGATLGVGATLLSLAALSGYKVVTDPRSSQFLKIQDKNEKGSTYYDILGGLPQYVRLLSQIATGKSVSANGKVTDLSAKRGKTNPFGTTRGDLELRFLRGKLSPVIGSAINLQEGRDVVGQPYHLWPQVPEEFVPLPYTDVQEAYQVGGIKNALKVLIPSQFGISVSSYNPNAPKKK